MIRRFVLAALIAVGVSTLALRWVPTQPPVLQQAATAAQGHLDLKLPLEDKSVRFAVIGDNGTGDQPQYDVAAEMEAYHKIVGFDFVVMKIEVPHKRLKPSSTWRVRPNFRSAGW